MRTSSSRVSPSYYYAEEEKKNLLAPVFDHATVAIRSLRHRVASIARIR